MAVNDQFDNAISTLFQKHVTRRTLAKRVFVLGVGATGIAGLLAACGGSDDEDPTNTPTEAEEATEEATEEVSSETEAPEEAEATEEVGSEETEAATEAASEEETEAASEEETAAEGSSETSSDARLVVALNAGGASNDPARTTAQEDWTKIQNSFNGLLRWQPGGFELEPDLAETWEVSDTAPEYTFSLRSGVQFHEDFGECTAEDVVFSFERQLDPDFEGAVNRAQLDAIDTLEAVDSHTVKITTKSPTASFLAEIALGRPMTGAIVSKAAADELGNDTYSEHPIGTGPFVFESQIPNEEWRFRRFEDYFEGPAWAAEVVMRNMSDEATRVLAIETGEVHLGVLDSIEFMEQYADHPDANLMTGPRTSVDFLMLNHTIPPFDNVDVRLALNLAVNVEELIEGVLGGYGAPASRGIMHPGMVGYDDSLEPFPYDPELAQSMLADAGVSDLAFHAVSYAGAKWETLLVLMQEHFRLVGVDFTFDQLERGALTEARARDDQQSVVLAGLGAAPEPSLLLSRFHSNDFPPGGLNVMRYSGADDLIDQANTELDPDKRIEVLKQVQQQFAKDIPAIVLWHPDSVSLLSGSVDESTYVVDPMVGQWLHKVALKSS